jgi:hypothetical protein
MRNIRRRLVVWVIIVALILLVPLVAMQFTDEVNWTRSDFVVAGVLLFGSALIYELATKNMSKPENRLAIGIVVAVVLLWLWAELAVGVFTDWGS